MYSQNSLQPTVTRQSLQPQGFPAIFLKCYTVTAKNTLPIEKRLTDKMINVKEKGKHFPRVGKLKIKCNIVTKSVKPRATGVYRVTTVCNCY